MGGNKISESTLSVNDSDFTENGEKTNEMLTKPRF